MGRTATLRVKRIKRRRGYCVQLIVEVDSSQYDRFTRTVLELGLTKTDAVQQAIELWMGSLPQRPGGE